MTGREQTREGPLKGTVVVDLTQWFAGPLATSWLGDMGADVIKIERPGGGDPTRRVDSVLKSGLSSYFAGLNRNKRSVALDLSSDAGAAAVRRIIERADVLVENFRPGVMNRLGLGYPEVSQDNPRLVYCSVSSFGDEGPLAGRPGMDIIVQAMGGVMGLTGPRGGPPFRVGAPVADYVGSLQAMSAITLALHERTRSGRGQQVKVSLLDGQMAMLSNYMAGFFVTGQPDGPVGNYHPQLVPYQPYDTADGSVIVACLTEEFWRRMCAALNLPHLLEDPRYATNADRVAHRQELNAELEPVIAQMTSDELVTRLEAADVPCGPILSMADLVSHPQVAASETIIELDHPEAGRYHAVAAPFRLTGSPARPHVPAPGLGAHTAEVLREFGCSAAEIARVTRLPEPASADGGSLSRVNEGVVR
jgi:crotonobetainyl-CoA:carnitine CoA-transferase CaiB-like acyl-CoA transferase